MVERGVKGGPNDWDAMVGAVVCDWGVGRLRVSIALWGYVTDVW